MMVNLAIRGYADNVQTFEHNVSFEEEALSSLVPELALKHATALASHALHMIEIEFLDEPNPNERFFRFGTDPGGMVLPLEVSLRGKAERGRTWTKK